MSLEGQGRRGTRGFAMAGLLVTITVMAVALSVALPIWKTVVQREREEELIFRGKQYARAIQLYQRKFANAYPPNFDVLVSGRFLRKKYKDPMTGEDFQPLYGAAAAPNQPPGAPQLRPPATGARPSPSPATPPQAAGSPGVAGAAAGLMGVTSKSTATSIREYNGRKKYNEWTFVAQVVTQQPGAPPGSGRPGAPAGGPGGPTLRLGVPQPPVRPMPSSPRTAPTLPGAPPRP